MKILTAAQMREVDRRTSEERGVPSLILMENAGSRVYEFLAERFATLERQRVAVVCGKGNNGGDGLVVARQLHTRARAGKLQVVLAVLKPGRRMQFNPSAQTVMEPGDVLIAMGESSKLRQLEEQVAGAAK